MLTWSALNRETFERTVEALVIRVYGTEYPNLMAKAVDGRGGDEGIDVEVRERSSGRMVRILQLKHFPEGFSGLARKRRSQIAASYRRAMEMHAPPEWTLVVPRNLSLEEVRFLQTLQDEYPGTAVNSWGSAELDSMLARHPDLADYVEREPLRTALDRVGRATSALSTTSDLVAETLDLRRRAAGWSSYWAPRISHDNGRDVIRFEALRDDASEREPLTMSFRMEFDGHEQQRQELVEAMEYGATESVKLSPEIVREVRRIGPDWYSGSNGPGTLVLGPVAESDTKGRVTCVDPNGRRLASRPAVIQRVATGSKGGRVNIDINDGITLTVQLIFGTDGGSMKLTSSLDGLSGAAAHRHLLFADALAQSASIKLAFDSFDSEILIAGDRHRPHPELVDLAEDAATIELLADITFSWPHDYDPSASERAWIRVTRLILEGKTTFVPDFSEVTLDVNELDDELVALLTSSSPVVFPVMGWTVPMFGESVLIGDILCSHHSMRADDGETILAGLHRGETQTVRVVATDDAALRIWLPEMSGSTDPGEPRPWGIPSIEEPKA